MRKGSCFASMVRASFVVLLFLSVMVYPCCAGIVHDDRTISAVATVEGDPYISVVFDGNGVAHIAYYDRDRGCIKHVYGGAGEWMDEVVAYTAGTKSVSVAIDPNNEPWISYGDGLHFGNLMVAHKSSTGWETMIVATGGYPKTGAVLGGVAGAVGGGVLGAMTEAGVGYTVGESVGDSGQYSSLDIGPDGGVHVAYNGGQHFASLYYSTYTPISGEWVTDCVDSAAFLVGDTGYAPSLKMDRSGRPHIAYLNGKHFPSLMYATREGKTWTVVEVDNGGSSTGSVSAPSLAIDMQGCPHISYFNEGTMELRYASFTDGVWTSEIVSHHRDHMGKFTTLMIGPNGVRHIIYIDAAPLDPSTLLLMYAMRSDTFKDWYIRPCLFVGGGKFGEYPSLALDECGHAGFVFCDTTHHKMWFGHWTE